MQTMLLVASLWANADPATHRPQPIGPWLTAQAQRTLRLIHEARARLDRWAEKTFDVAFDIQVLALADDADREIRFVAEIDERKKGSIVLPQQHANEVRSMVSHIMAAGDARIAAEHTVVTSAGTPGLAATYVKVGMTYIDPTGLTRVGLTKRPEGDSFRVHPTALTLSNTRFSITVYSNRMLVNSVATSEMTEKANLKLGESLLILREAPSPAVSQANRVVTAGAVVPEQPPAQAALIIVTPRRVVRAGESKPRS